VIAEALRNLERLHPRSLRLLASHLALLVEKRLWLKVLVGMFAGLGTGLALGPTAGLIDPELGSLIGSWLALPGQLFLAAIQMIVIPLVFASIILGLASSENAEQLKRLGIAATIYFVITTAMAAVIGLGIAVVMEPGVALSHTALPSVPSSEHAKVFATPRIAELPQVLVGLLPGNPLGSMVEGQMLQIVIFSIIVGIALVTMAPVQSKPLLDLLTSLQLVCMTVVRWAMWLAPIAVFGLMARLMTQLGLNALVSMAHYVLTVLVGLALLFGLYLLIVWLSTRRRPMEFIRATRELLLLAFSTSSSAAVMPLSIKTAEENLSIKQSVAQFIVPLGATINMNGTALYQGAATVFLAQAYNIDIGISGMLLVVALAVGASIGSPATPGVGIVILATVLATVGIPPEGIALILGVDRILDMCRTAINVAGDLVACLVMERWLDRPSRSTTETTSAVDETLPS
jgi:Na+/H+-dicarboxylate symporter